MSEIEFAAPSSAGVWKPAESLGHLLVIEVLEHQTGISTAYGVSDALRCNVHDVTASESYSDALIFTGSLINALKNLVGSKVLATLEHGKAKPGQSPPYLLVNAVEDAKAVAQAKAFLAKTQGYIAGHVEMEGKRDPELQAALDELMKKKMTKEQEDVIPF